MLLPVLSQLLLMYEKETKKSGPNLWVKEYVQQLEFSFVELKCLSYMIGAF